MEEEEGILDLAEMNMYSSICTFNKKGVPNDLKHVLHSIMYNSWKMYFYSMV
jgi:hypothetical protein